MLRKILNAVARTTGKYGRKAADFLDGGSDNPSIIEGIRVAHAAGALEVQVPRADKQPVDKDAVRAYAKLHERDIGDY